jgi:tRNA pseudouridine32 synthase/23S rRNA pseudouridine746 synthase
MTNDEGDEFVIATPVDNRDGTRYRITRDGDEDRSGRWIRVSFDDAHDASSSSTSTSTSRGDARNDGGGNAVDGSKSTPAIANQRRGTANSDGNGDRSGGGGGRDESSSSSLTSNVIPESVLTYQRQLRKVQANDRASNTNVNINDHLRVVHVDEHVVVANKPSGLLCVPGVNGNRSLLDLVYESYGSGRGDEKNKDDTNACEDDASSSSHLPRDSMIVHRLDMDTSGIVIFARTRTSMSILHAAFRDRIGTNKVYEALLVGWLDIDKWMERASRPTMTTPMGDDGDGDDAMARSRCDESNADDDDATGTAGTTDTTYALGGGEIDLPLQRDHRHPPFMRVSTPESEDEARRAVRDLNHAGYTKLIARRPKMSTTRFRILSHEYWMGHPVTRIELIPITGRTHQLRVHCAAIGHPILGDPAYGYCGEAHPNGGFSDRVIGALSPTCASFELRRTADDDVRDNGRTMCLHARRLTLRHPITNEEITFEANPSF